MKLNTIFGAKSTTDIKIFIVYQNDVESKGRSKYNRLLNRFGIAPGLLTQYGFSGNKDELFEFYSADKAKNTNTIFIGIGSKEKYVPDNCRRAGGILAGVIANRKINKVTVISIPEDAASIGAFIEGILLGGYSFDRFKSKKNDELTLKLNLGVGLKKYKKDINKSKVLAEAVYYARDLINTPANFLTPAVYAGKAKTLAGKYGIKTRIYSPKEIIKMKMGAIMGVAKGSEQPPRLITWTYSGGKRGEPPIALVGKGVTFDTGGISLKPSDGMIDMKNDMAGSATVVSQMIVLGRLKPRINVVGIIPAVENMPSGKALKPSDIITASDGQTIEVMNTDAEGRLILADGLCFAHKFKPKAIFDIATLTGAVKIALGTNAAGILGTDDKLLKQLYDIGQKTAEKTWQLPLWDEYYEQIKSETADMKNTGGRPAGTITAAAFLSKFVKGIPWSHIDIAAVDNQVSSHPYQPKGATGFGVRLLAELLLSWK
ncbi:MAG: leucyl aminopeptidase [candidate division Zixibacteria bacterium]|nr:leucyl aminopeptidase [candidate division Zixibacteria bacterium]